MKYRIAYIIDNLERGGTQTALIYLVCALAQKNYQQCIYSLNNRIDPLHRQRLLDCGVEIKIMSKLQLITGLAWFRVLYHWWRQKPTIVFTLLYYSDILGRIWAKLANIPIIISSIRARNVYKNRWMLMLDRITAPWADKIVCNSRSIIPFALEHEGIHQQQIVYIPNGVKVNSNQQRDKRAELGIDSERLLLGSIGRLMPQKGFEDLLAAVVKVKKYFPQCLLLIIGSGKLLDSLHALVHKLNLEDNVMFLGQRDDITELLLSLDIYIQASLFEGMPNAVMEAMALGKAVIATAVDGTLELITDNETGWLVPPAQPALLAEKICYGLSHPQEAQRIGQAAAQHMAKDFSVEKMVTAYDHLFQELIITHQ